MVNLLIYSIYMLIGRQFWLFSHVTKENGCHSNQNGRNNFQKWFCIHRDPISIFIHVGKIGVGIIDIEKQIVYGKLNIQSYNVSVTMVTIAPLYDTK